MEPTAAEPKVWLGDARGDDEVAMLASGGYTDITGNLIIVDSGINTIAFPLLQSVGGHVEIYDSYNLTTITLSATTISWRACWNKP